MGMYPKFYGVVSKNREDIKDASSGGTFFEVAKFIIIEGGIVYGAVLDGSFKAVHMRAETIEKVKLMRKSKYIRSDVKNIYSLVKKDLLSGKKVLFSGVGCQIAGLYSYLGKDNYNNLYTCEVVCHGMPLKMAIEKYISEQEKNNDTQLKKIDFRIKEKGWLNNCILEKYSNGMEILSLSSNHPVHRLYLDGINMESSCGKCIYQKLPRIADITLADFWLAKDVGFYNYIKDGVSLVSINNIKGKELLQNISNNIIKKSVSEELALKSCRHMSTTPRENRGRRAFQTLISQYEFGVLYPIFLEFGEIVLADELFIKQKFSLIEKLRVFVEDIGSNIYIINNENKLCDVITVNSILNEYTEEKTTQSYENSYVMFEKGCEKNIRKIFDLYPRINRIPIVDNMGVVLFEVHRKKEKKNDELKKIYLIDSLLRSKGIQSLYIHRPDEKTGYRYSITQQLRMKYKIDFSKILNDIELYQEDEIEILGNVDDLYNYVMELGKIPAIVKVGNRYLHENCRNKLVTVVNGRRYTCNQNYSAEKKIHIYGRCGVFGYAVEDEETMPSQLQKLLNDVNKDYKVINHGLWGADNSKIIGNLLEDLECGYINECDIVIIYMLIPKEFRIKNFKNKNVIDITEEFHKNLENRVNFYDKPGHMNAEGYHLVAKRIYEWLDKNCNTFMPSLPKSNEYNKKVKYKEIYSIPREVKSYLERIKNEIPISAIENKKVGSIVMNCNPFTKGHQYLISKASKSVDTLLIFVVEEDKSSIPFMCRYEMVKSSAKEFDNVYIVPSGKFIISAETFPEYFTKDEKSDVVVMPTDDIEIFAKYIAPFFNIKYRFVGTEPIDNITRQYNETIKEILPCFDINFIEIERLKIMDEIVSATYVRKIIEDGDVHELQKYLPISTIEILKKWNILKYEK